MIIKSTSRKAKSFGQLLEYLTREDFNTYSWNMYSKKENIKKVIDEFMDNASHLDNARGSVFMYHDILSLGKNNYSLKKQKEMLHDLVSQYVSLRGDNKLVFSVTHTDKQNLHCHLVISSNEIGSNKRVRLSKKEFNQIQQQVESYQNKHYAKAFHTSFYKNIKDFTKSKQAEQEMKHKRNKQSQREFVREHIQKAIKTASNKKQFNLNLEQDGFELYTRGKHTGVKFKNMSYRFQTLALDKTYTDFTKSHQKSKQKTYQKESSNQQQRSNGHEQ